MTQHKKHAFVVAEEKNTGKMKTFLPAARVQGYNKNGKRITSRNTRAEETRADLNLYGDNKPWSSWGIDDLLPTRIRQGIESVPIASTTVADLVRMMYGNGIVYYRKSDLKDGDNTVNRAFIPEVENFIEENRINEEWLPSQIVDYRYMMNTFSEVIWDKLHNNIISIYPKTTEFCRLEKQDESTLRIENMLYHPYFADSTMQKFKDIQRVPLYQPNKRGWLQKFRGGKMAIHSRFPSPGIKYYARPWWLGLFNEDGWIDVAKEIPKLIRAMHKNQISIKYQILIPESYFEIRYDWGHMTQKERNKKFKELEDKITDQLVGSKNAYKTLTSYFGQDAYGKDSGKIEIKPIDDKIKNGEWVPDSEKADQQIVQGLGQHPSQAGLQPTGGKMGAGSGSDQRESFNKAITLNTLDQNIILEPLNLISRINGWNVKFKIDHTWHTTTNNQENGLEPSSTSLNIE